MKKFKTSKTIFIMLIAFIISISIRLISFKLFKTLDYKDPPLVTEGILDLRGFEFTDHQTLPLNGEWEFYPSYFIYDNDGEYKEKTYLNVPGDWNKSFSSVEDNKFTYGSYRLTVLLDDIDYILAYRIGEIYKASKVYVDGKLVGECGKVGKSLGSHETRLIPYSIRQKANGNSVEVVIQVSNPSGKGGINLPIRMGSGTAINKRVFLSVSLQILTVTFLLTHSVYALTLYLLGEKNRGLIYFALLSFFASACILLADDKLLLLTFNINYLSNI